MKKSGFFIFIYITMKIANFKEYFLIKEALKEDIQVGSMVICNKNLENVDGCYYDQYDTKGEIAEITKIKKIRANHYGETIKEDRYTLKFQEKVKCLTNSGGRTTIDVVKRDLKHLEILPAEQVEKIKTGDLLIYKDSKILHTIFKSINFKPKSSILDCSYFDIDPDSPDMITYYPAAKIKGKKEEEFEPKQKQKLRVGRLFRKLNPGLTDPEVEDLVNEYRAAYQMYVKGDVGDRLRVVTGEDIRFWYLQSNYATTDKNSDDELHNSCMRYKEIQPRLKIYSENPDKIALAILVDGSNKLLARALVWQLDKGKVFMDRIYYINPADKKLLSNYAKKNGMLTFPLHGKHRVTLTKNYGSEMKNPYMDTFHTFVANKKKKEYFLSNLYEYDMQDDNYDNCDFYEWDYAGF